MKTQHTPGPWEVGHDEGDCTPSVYFEARDICVLETHYGDSEANARLIAAAPGLLGIADAAQAAARNICENAEGYKKLTIPQLHFFIETTTAMLSGLATVANAAIAKATKGATP